MSDAKPIVVIGSGPAGMAAALALNTVGHRPILLERYPQARPAGNILNLWPPPIKALQAMGVDTNDLGAPCHTTFRGVRGNVRADVQIPERVAKEYGGGFIGLLRPELYRRMLAALPDGVLRTDQEVTGIRDHVDGVTVTLGDGSSIEAAAVVGADGIDSSTDRPKRPRRATARARRSSLPTAAAPIGADDSDRTRAGRSRRPCGLCGMPDAGDVRP